MNSYLYSGSIDSLQSIKSKLEYPDNYSIQPISDVEHNAVLMGEVQYLGDSFQCAFYTHKTYRENDEYIIISKHATLRLDLDDNVIVRAF